MWTRWTPEICRWDQHRRHQVPRWCQPIHNTGGRPSAKLSECVIGVSDSFEMDVCGGSSVGDFLPVRPREYPLDREHLGCAQSGLDAGAERRCQRLFVFEQVLRKASREAWRAEYQAMKRHHLGMVIEAGYRLVA